MQYIVHILTFPQHFRFVNKNRFVQIKFMTTQFEFYQTVLKKVSFDQHLFKKEYKKAMNELSLSERIILKQWCKQSLKYSLEVVHKKH